MLAIRPVIWQGALLACVATASIAQEVLTPELQRNVDSYVEPYLRLNTFSGVVLIAKDGKALLTRAYGMANHKLNVANSAGTRFQIASVSKPFTAGAVLLLQQQGKLTVSDPVQKYVPDFRNGDRISLHHLLTHTSGIPNINDFPEYSEWSRLPQTPASLTAKFKDKPLEFEPGARYSYSNSNYNLLAYVVEIISGQRYGEFLKNNIFGPLGMTHSGHNGPAGAGIPNRAAGYTPVSAKDVENAPYLNWSIKTGNGSLYSTVGDLLKFNQALYTDKLLNADQRRQMFTEHVPGVGYGWFVGRRNERPVVRISGRSPGFTAEMRHYVQDDLTVIVLSNNYASASQDMVTDLADIYFGREVRPREIPVIADLNDAQLRRYEGTYRFGEDFFVPDGTYTVQAGKDHLVLRYDENNKFPLVPLETGEFYNRMFGGRMRFDRTAEDELVLVWVAGSREFRAPRVQE